MIQTIKEYFDLGDGRLYYEIAGAGMPLVLSHAAFLDSRMFDAVWEPLAQHFRVIRYDMRGYGQSSPVNEPLCRRHDLERLLDHLGVAQAHFVGCSNGGQITLDLALEQPQRAASLCLVGSSPSGFEVAPPLYMLEMFEATQRGEIERASELQIRIWLDGQYREPEQVDTELRKKALEMNRIPVAHNTFLAADTQPANPIDPPAITQLETVNCPTLIIAGALDHPEVLRAADEMAARIPKAQKTILESCGHVPSYEQPGAFAQLLLDFLGGVNASVS